MVNFLSCCFQPDTECPGHTHKASNYKVVLNERPEAAPEASARSGLHPQARTSLNANPDGLLSCDDGAQSEDLLSGARTSAALLKLPTGAPRVRVADTFF